VTVMVFNELFLDKISPRCIPITPVTVAEWDGWHNSSERRTQAWIRTAGLKIQVGKWLLLPDKNGEPQRVVLIGAQNPGPWAVAHLSSALPKGDYYLDCTWDTQQLHLAAMGWGMEAYRFNRYKTRLGDRDQRNGARLALSSGMDRAALEGELRGIYLTRDLINTPPNDMMPAHLGEAAHGLARQFSARCTEITGKDLLKKNFPAIHAVGRASSQEPRLIDLRWGDKDAPRLTLVGKGVCFDSGGLNIKAIPGMRLMKKDMGGAAHALGLAGMIMSASLPVRLRVLIPAVENAISGNAYRPGDILSTRKGLQVEVDNTDAEGRIILSDALCCGAEEAPDLMVDFATLTGAARIALGVDLPAMFTNRDKVSGAIMGATWEVQDPVWPMPLHQPYRELLDSQVADIVNSTQSPWAGAITAALFLQEFVPDSVAWVHFDVMAWNMGPRAGRPEGGEAMGLRALFTYLKNRYPAP